MDITFACRYCGQSIVIDEASAGTETDCPRCGTPVVVPYASEPLGKAAKPPRPQPSRSLPIAVLIGLMLFFLYAALSYSLLSHDLTLDGEVFIITKGGESIKLGLVPIELISLPDLTSYLNQRMATATNEIARLEPLIKAAGEEYSRLVAVREAEFKQFNSVLELPYTSASTDAESALTEYLELKAQRDHYYSADFYFEALPAPFRSTKTNRDGRFKIQVSPYGSYILAAFTSRLVGGSIERYYWLLPVNPHGESLGEITLSNENLFQPKAGNWPK